MSEADQGRQIVVTGNMPLDNDNTVTKKVERYDIKRHKWVELADLNTGRS